jgi:hypothetical protein
MEAAGIEPATATPETPSRQGVRHEAPETLAQTLARISGNEPGLARVLDAWPGLSGPIRQAILALVESDVFRIS